MTDPQKPGLTYHDLRAALSRPGCPICQVRSERLERFFFWFQNETYCVPAMVEELIQAGGFCATHTRVLTNRYVGTITAQYVLATVRVALERIQIDPPPHRKRRRAVMPSGICPACARAAEEDTVLIDAWIEALAKPEFHEQVARSDGLCLPHLRRVIDQAPADSIAGFLQGQIEQLKRLEVELAEYLRKVDYRFANEPKGNEQTAWQRAWERLGGWPLDRLTNNPYAE
jgi:hypothetical protein